MIRHLVASSALFGLAFLSPWAFGQTPQIQATVEQKLTALRKTAQTPDIDAVAAKAVAYLRKTQEENGGWSTKLSPGVTGIVVTG
ncbi:MAG: hypothetical protein ACKO9Z_13960, partial [Planctomycetota bacterium]